MRDVTRRDALLAGGLSVGTLVAGCLEESGEAGDDDNDGDNGGAGEGDTGVRDIEHLQLGTARGQADWARDDETIAIAYRFESPSDYGSAESTLLEWTDVDTEEFVAETDFSEEMLVLIGVIGSNGCYTEVTLEALSIEDGQLVGEAHATREDEDAEACDHAITYPHALVRIEVEGEIPEQGELSVSAPGGKDDTIEIVPYERAATEVIDTNVLQLGGTNSKPHWARSEDDRTGAVYRLDRMLAFPSPDAMTDSEEADEFLDEHDGDNTMVLQVGSVGPATNYNQLSFENIDLVDETLTGDVSVEAEGEVGGPSITYPWALLAVEFDNDAPSKATFQITDGWETTAEASTEDEISLDPESLDGYVQPDGSPVTVPDALECDDDDFERHLQSTDEEDIVLGDSKADGEPTWAMRVEETSYELGETVNITLTNVSGKELVTGNSSKHNFQLYTDEGWQDVRGTDPDTPVGYTDEGIIHSTGAGFEWEFELTEDGIVSENQNEEHLTVCPSLQPGRYRFLFWDPEIAVEFDVTE